MATITGTYSFGKVAVVMKISIAAPFGGANATYRDFPDGLGVRPVKSTEISCHRAI
jgi:hypothetical protein